MTTLQQITRDFNLNYSLDDVKKAIELVSELSKKTYTIKSKNEAFNSYSMTLVGGVTVVMPQIQLKKISDDETNLVLTCTLGHGSASAPMTANEIIDKFFMLVGKSLSGEEINEKVIAKEKAGCFTIFIGLTGIGASVLYYMFS